ncbi:TetR family transcriptional regulator [Streptococcus catagoni]|uniref:TetR family transcriptional regulator n=1 Tax=Streptococcus catagoni TaxID=2654874 RepID=UPI0014090B68|nr:TetR family transcriptional regulator [Streptococcus catagoni]
MQKRQRNTKKQMQKALIELLEQKDFEAITTSELCLKAGINRGTFYLHYQDKYDMLDQFKNDILDQLFTILDDQSIYTDTEKILEKTLWAIKDNFTFIAAMSKSTYINFNQTMKDFIYKVLLTITDHKKILNNYYGIPYHYGLEVYLSSIVAIISLWIENDGIESPRQITDYILKTVSIETDH